MKTALHLASRTEFSRYFWAGSMAFAADFLVLLVLTEVFGINYLWSNLVSVSVGLMTSYLLCIKWVFSQRRYDLIAYEVSLFILTSLVGLALNEFLLWLLVEFCKVHYLGAKIAVTLAVFVVNFAMKKTLLFSR